MTKIIGENELSESDRTAKRCDALLRAVYVALDIHAHAASMIILDDETDTPGVYLDGEFTASELRAVADALDGDGITAEDWKALRRAHHRYPHSDAWPEPKRSEKP